MSYLKMVPTYQRPSNKRREYLTRLVEIIRENPDIQRSEILKLFYPNGILDPRQSEGLIGMLLDLQLEQKIERRDDRYYVVEVE
jgi:hypothetical protein